MFLPTEFMFKGQLITYLNYVNHLSCFLFLFLSCQNIILSLFMLCERKNYFSCSQTRDSVYKYSSLFELHTFCKQVNSICFVNTRV